MSPQATPAVPVFSWLLALRLELLDAAVKAREDAISFDSSRLVEFSERLVWEGPAAQLSPLVRETGRLAVTDQRVYFQPLHNISGTTAAAGLASKLHVTLQSTQSVTCAFGLCCLYMCM